MTKTKTRALVCVALLLLLVPILIQPAKAIKSGDNLWYEYWGNHKEYGHETPEILSTTTTVYDETYKYWAKVALVVSVYHYSQYLQYPETVGFGIAVYWDSFAEEGFQPIPANYVNLYLDKDTAGSNLNDQKIDIEKSPDEAFQQGWLLDQNIWTDSDYDDREYWAWQPLCFAASLFLEPPLGIVPGLISLAAAWLPGGGVDYIDADWGDPYAQSHWHRNQAYDITLNPVRQYCLNSYRWFLRPDVKPSTYFGLKVSARVTPADPRFGYYVDLPPVYLRIYRSQTQTLSISASGGGSTNPAPGTYPYNYGQSVTVTASAGYHYEFKHWWLDGEKVYGNPYVVTMDSDHTLKPYFEYIGGGGGGCPILSVYDGSGYVEEGLLDIHNPDGIDLVTSHVLIHTPETVEHRYLLRLTEHPQTYSHIDQVQLFATLKDGTEIKLPLVSAVHSEDGDVLYELLLSDDVRADTLGADHNNGTSEWIDLEFVAPEGLEIETFTFIIEGHNVPKKN